MRLLNYLLNSHALVAQFGRASVSMSLFVYLSQWGRRIRVIESKQNVAGSNPAQRTLSVNSEQ